MLTSQREVDGIVILEFEEDTLDLYTAPEFKKTIISLVQNGKRKIVLNLKNIIFIDSSGLGSLLFTNSQLKDNNGRLIFSNLGG